MSPHIHRHDPIDQANRTDESSTFKKPYQIVDRPRATKQDIHEDYFKHPPHNEPGAISTHWRTGDVEESGRGEDEAEGSREDVLGSPSRGKRLKEAVLEEMTTESSVHARNAAS